MTRHQASPFLPTVAPTRAPDTDLDGDGYSGVYAYDIDPITGLHVNQTGDAFPSDATQWFDQDGDGYGDNPSPANNADDCPTETGTSYIDFLDVMTTGRFRDENEPEALRGDATQWRPDFDGYGDNWGDPSGTPRATLMAGPIRRRCDQCRFLSKNHTCLQVDDEGCHISERDSDLDGVMDDADNRPKNPRALTATTTDAPMSHCLVMAKRACSAWMQGSSCSPLAASVDC